MPNDTTKPKPEIAALRDLARKLCLDAAAIEDMTRFSDADIRAMDDAVGAAQSIVDTRQSVLRRK